MICKKTKFLDEQQAKYYIEKLNKTSIRDSKPVRAYLCDICINWHITSKKETKSPSEEIKIRNKIITNQVKKIRYLKSKIEKLNKSNENITNN